MGIPNFQSDKDLTVRLLLPVKLQETNVMGNTSHTSKTNGTLPLKEKSSC